MVLCRVIGEKRVFDAKLCEGYKGKVLYSLNGFFFASFVFLVVFKLSLFLNFQSIASFMVSVFYSK